MNGFWNREVKSTIAVSRVRVGLCEKEPRQTMINSTAGVMETYGKVALAYEDVRVYEENLARAEDLLARPIKRQQEGLSTVLEVRRAREAVASRSAAECLTRMTSSRYIRSA